MKMPNSKQSLTWDTLPVGLCVTRAADITNGCPASQARHTVACCAFGWIWRCNKTEELVGCGLHCRHAQILQRLNGSGWKTSRACRHGRKTCRQWHQNAKGIGSTLGRKLPNNRHGVLCVCVHGHALIIIRMSWTTTAKLTNTAARPGDRSPGAIALAGGRWGTREAGGAGRVACGPDVRIVARRADRPRAVGSGSRQCARRADCSWAQGGGQVCMAPNVRACPAGGGKHAPQAAHTHDHT